MNFNHGVLWDGCCLSQQWGDYSWNLAVPPHLIPNSLQCSHFFQTSVHGRATNVTCIDSVITGAGIKSKLIKISKSKHESAMKTIDQIIDKLFPNGGLQERTTNFFSFCPDGNYADKLDALYDCISPEEKDLLILEES